MRGKAELEFEKWLTKYYGDTFMLADGSELPIMAKVNKLLAAQRREWVGKVKKLKVPEFHELPKRSKGKLKAMTSYGAFVDMREAVNRKLADILKELEEA